MSSPAITSPDDPTCGVPLVPLRRFWSPRWWPVWIALGIVRALAALPWALQATLARALGRVAWYVARRDRRTTLINLRLAYPGLTERERRAIARRHFHSLVYSLFETGLVWFDRRGRLERLTRLEGREHLDAALAAGRGVLLVGAHFTTNEIAAAALPQTGHQFDIMYKRSGNELLNQLALRGRLSRRGRMIPNDKFAELLKVLKRGGCVLYAPDQRFDGQGSIVVPLFGVPALSNPGTTFIARATRCAVLPFFPLRLADGSGYVMSIGAPLADFPSGDGARDVARYHALIEAAVAKAPEQYLWSYKRFRPRDGEPDPYRGGSLRGAR
ncbi:MAG TPA: lysophospholipid acyltransferase family protein [Steroidobacteraceae bacterium]|nr:lysophospholipid acyltransferase family protein [Steroidobacteraceae bacterium]